MRMRPSAVVLVAGVVFLVAADRVPPPPMDCHNLKSQKSLDLEKMLGTWYAVEIVEHYMTELRSGKAELDQCPMFTLSREMNHTGNVAPFRMLWKEGDAFTVEYRLTIPEEHHKGFWRSAGHQNGSLAEDSRYRQFVGSIHVMKVTSDHAVLTFCSELERQVYSVVLSRDRALIHSDLQSIENMLDRRRLPINYTKRTCRASRLNGASATGPTAAILVLTLGLGLLVTRYRQE